MEQPLVDKSNQAKAVFKRGSLLLRTIWYFSNLLFFVNPFFPFRAIKPVILRLFGAKIGQKCLIKPGVRIRSPWLLVIGDHVSIGERVWIDNVNIVIIEDQATLSQEAVVLTGEHSTISASFNPLIKESTQIIGEGAWLCTRSILGAGKSVGKYAILSMGSIANVNLKEFGIYQGNPAKFKTKRVIRD